LFDAIDTNSDGLITIREMEDAMQAFARLDGNKDGKLSKEEAGATSGDAGYNHDGGAGRGAGRFAGSAEGTPAGGRGPRRGGAAGTAGDRFGAGRGEVATDDSSTETPSGESRPQRPAAASRNRKPSEANSGNPFADE
jgi:hypothetical protein